ncbi:hypothetical protein ABTU78_20130, partial [Acinetobacter baumannii]
MRLRDAKAHAEWLHAVLECPRNPCNYAVYAPANSANEKCRIAAFFSASAPDVAQLPRQSGNSVV